MKKERLDTLLVQRGFFESRSRAQAAIMAGQVLVNEQKIDKTGTQVAPDAAIRLLGGDLKIKYTDDAVFMTGSATRVFDGEVDETKIL